MAALGAFTTEILLHETPSGFYPFWNASAASLVFFLAAALTAWVRSLIRAQVQHIEELKLLRGRLEANMHSLTLAQSLARLGSCQWNPSDDTVQLSEQMVDFLQCGAAATRDLPGLLVWLPDSAHLEMEGALRQTALDGQSRTLRLSLERDHGTLHLECRTTAFRNETGPAVLLAALDVTDRVLVEKLRFDAERMLHHDLRNPLLVVVNLPKLMLDDVNLSRQQRELLEVIARAGEQVLQVINLSADLLRIESGNLVSATTSLDLAELLRDSARQLQALGAKRHIVISLWQEQAPLPPELNLTIRGDRTLCGSMLLNLLRNAVEAAPEGSEVRATLDSEGEHAVIRIHNLGAVPPEIRQRFFEKYTTSGKAGGTGLGTYSARLIAEAHRGRIAMETSESLGTTIPVHLPR